MKHLLKQTFIALSSIIFLFLSGIYSLADAHEIYVLSKQKFSQGLHAPAIDTLQALGKPANLQFTVMLILIVLVVLSILFFFRYTKLGQKVNKQLQQLSQIGLLAIRLALGVAFLYAASSNTIFGPELSLNSLPFHQILPYAEYLIGILLVCGLFTEIAATLAFILYFFAVFAYGTYLLTYINYLGEIATLILFGSRFLSFDTLIFGKLKRFPKLRAYENTIIRVCYGGALLYAAIYIKVIHAQIPLDVIYQYHLNQIHWLFPNDPILIVLGAAIVEIVIAVFIIVGFSTRFTNLILMFYLTLSILFFKETVWPHYMLYGISFSLFFNGGGKLSIDEILTKHLSRKKVDINS